MAASADGCSQCWLSLLISPPLLSPLWRPHWSALSATLILPSPPCSVSPLRCCDFTFSLAFSSLFTSFTGSPLLCCFSPPASAAIGWLFVCTNPCPSCIAAVTSELSLSRCPPICSSAPPTSLVISTFDRPGLWAATVVDYRTVGHLARSVRLAVEGRSTGGRKLICSENTDDLFKLIFIFTVSIVTVHALHLCRDSFWSSTNQNLTSELHSCLIMSQIRFSVIKYFACSDSGHPVPVGLRFI